MSDFVEVHEYWRLCTKDEQGQLRSNIWVQINMSLEIRDIIVSLDASIYYMTTIVIFKHAEDIVVFRLRAGV